jgi:hypothetical protein
LERSATSNKDVLANDGMSVDGEIPAGYREDPVFNGDKLVYLFKDTVYNAERGILQVTYCSTLQPCNY